MRGREGFNWLRRLGAVWERIRDCWELIVAALLVVLAGAGMMRSSLTTSAEIETPFEVASGEAELASDPAYLDSLPEAKVTELFKEIREGRGASLSDNDANRLVAHLRQQYPLESIEDRIPKRHPKSKRRRTVVGAEADEDLEAYEALNGRAARTWGDDVRSDSLQLLHEEQVREFVARDGNGFGRTPPPSAIHLALPDTRGIEFDRAIQSSESQRSPKTIELPSESPRINEMLSRAGESESAYHRAYAAYRKWAETHNPLLMPDEGRLRYIHQSSHDSFLHQSLVGYVRSPKAVAGFVGHRIQTRPIIDMADNRWSVQFVAKRLSREERAAIDMSDPATEAPRDAIWLLTDLRLVSLLMHAKPRVYDSNHLPDMSELDASQTVPLDDFESRSLEQLYAGGHLETEATLNEIRMLGAIRCSKTCVKCHDAERGELLGAFTYTLTRKDPL
ncbi:MAG: hypothetical protein AAFU85_00620 [Planctomycetota bacterium]